LEGECAELGETFPQPRVQAGVDRGEALEVAFGCEDRRFGRRAFAVAFLRGSFDRLEVAQQRARVFRRDETGAGAPTGDEHGGEHAEQGGGEEAQDAHAKQA
jgi:hypothetical protein